ncbi:hypothetical protein BX600DRAFT_226815 [Xylariales sp. PMI_506]|nr:hypothetical protein BX600DRAFT_226815 [Xylariales sp. PMI_506]
MPRKAMPDARNRRRRQNAEAQRLYRARQKERVRALEQQVLSARMGIQPVLSSPPRVMEHDADDLSSLNASDVRQALLPHLAAANENYYNISLRENFTLRDILKFGLIAKGHYMEPAIFQSSTSMSARRWIRLVQSSHRESVSIPEIISCGVRLISELSAPGQWSPIDWFPPLHFDIHSNHITVTSISFISALLANAFQLQLNPFDLLSDATQSRIYSPQAPKDEVATGDIDRHDTVVAGFPMDLAPTFYQRSIPHHPYLDLLPWPSFRSNCIAALSKDPPTIDEDDLCIDMLGGGLRCWGSTRITSANGHGQGTPWDSRSWEVMPWFLEKWEVIIGEDSAEMKRTSAWWRSM